MTLEQGLMAHLKGQTGPAGSALRAANAMVQQSRLLSGGARRAPRLTVSGGQSPYNIAHPSSMSFLRRMSSDQHGKGKSGPLPHLVICDEYHEQETTAMLEFFDAGQKSRRQPLTLITTNAGAGATTPCGQEHALAVRVAQGTVDDDAYFAYVCALDAGDDFFADESCWIKANPSLPGLPGFDYVRGQVAKARGMPSRRALVERLNACVWTEALSPWIGRDRWRSVEVDALPQGIEAAPCFAAVDLQEPRDLAAAARVWDLSTEDEARFAAEVTVWTPAKTLAVRTDRDDVPYGEWVDAGAVATTPGVSVGMAPAAAWIAELQRVGDLRGVAFYPYTLDVLEAALEDAGVDTTRDPERPGLLLAPHGQRFTAGHVRPAGSQLPLWMPRSMNVFEEAVLAGVLAARRNPALRWAALGAVPAVNAAKDRCIDREKSQAFTAPLVALVMALGFAAARPPETRSPLARYYDSGGRVEIVGV